MRSQESAITERSLSRPLRILLVSEGCYPFHPGGVSLFCDQLIRGMPQHSFTAVALSVYGNDRVVWQKPENLVEIIDLPLWGRRPRRPAGRPAPSVEFTRHYARLLHSMFSPLTRPEEGHAAAAFVSALRGLYEYAQQRDLTSAVTSNDSIDLLCRAWHNAGFDSSHPRALGRLSLSDALLAAERMEHLLRPLCHPPLRADICHLAMNGVSALVGLSSKWAYGTPLLMSEHGIYLRERYLALAEDGVSQAVKVIMMRFHRRLAAGAYRSADALAPHSQYNRRWQLQGNAAPRNMQTMYNGINPSEFPAAQSEPADPTIVFLGRIDPLKDLHTLIRAFVLVREKIPHARLRIFGPVPPGNEQYRDSCAQLIAQLRLGDAATLEGPIDHQTDAYRAGHIVALTSVSEGFPYTVVESMCMGRPQVCTNVGGVSEAVGNAGFVVPPRDHVAVAKACVVLLADPDLRHTLGQRARQRVLERFTLERWSNAYLRQYEELVAAPQVRRVIAGERERPAIGNPLAGVGSTAPSADASPIQSRLKGTELAR
jgi:polysaccharide biosynthesis protein PelF